jgi:hypothetical protein
MRGLSVNEEAYAVLYTWCTLQFPDVAQLLPKPPFCQPTPAMVPITSFSVQTPAPSPTTVQQPWLVPTSLSSTLPFPSNPSSFFWTCAQPDRCAFCLQPGHHVHVCPSAQEYVHTGRALILEDWLTLPNGQQIPNDGTGCRLKHGIDTWLVSQALAAPTSGQPTSFVQEVLPHIPTAHNNCTPSAHIEEVTEAHIIQVINNKGDSDSDDDDLFEVFATEKKMHEARHSKLLEFHSLPAPPADTTSSPSTLADLAAGTPVALCAPATIVPPASNMHSAPQYWYQSTAEDQRLILELEAWLMEGKLAQTTPTVTDRSRCRLTGFGCLGDLSYLGE